MRLTKFTLTLCRKLKYVRNSPTFSLYLQGCKLLTTVPDTGRFDDAYIRTHTVISRDHLTPELSLHLITPKCDLWFCKEGCAEFENDPFWAIYWPGGQALSRYILDNKELFFGKNVLDIGTGSGACAIAAAKSGANLVVANDIDALSLRAAKLNAALNNVELLLEGNNIIGKDIDSLKVMRNNAVINPIWDIILVGDMFYDHDFSQSLFSWLCELNVAGKSVFIGDPGRYAIKDKIQTKKLKKVADYPAVQEHFGFSTFSVWKLIC